MDRIATVLDQRTRQDKCNYRHKISIGGVSNSRFTGWEEVLREGNVSVPKTHYKLFYKYDINPNAEILLDVLFEKCYYLQTVKVPVASSWVMSTTKFSNTVS